MTQFGRNLSAENPTGKNHTFKISAALRQDGIPSYQMMVFDCGKIRPVFKGIEERRIYPLKNRSFGVFLDIVSFL